MFTSRGPGIFWGFRVSKFALNFTIFSPCFVRTIIFSSRCALHHPMEHDKNGCTALLSGPGSERCGRWFRQIRKGSTTYCLKRSPGTPLPPLEKGNHSSFLLRSRSTWIPVQRPLPEDVPLLQEVSHCETRETPEEGRESGVECTASCGQVVRTQALSLSVNE